MIRIDSGWPKATAGSMIAGNVWYGPFFVIIRWIRTIVAWIGMPSPPPKGPRCQRPRRGTRGAKMRIDTSSTLTLLRSHTRAMKPAHHNQVCMERQLFGFGFCRTVALGSASRSTRSFSDQMVGYDPATAAGSVRG